MKTKTPTINVSPRFSLRLAPTLVVAAVFILSVAAQLTYASPGDLFVSDVGSGNIYEFTPGGTRSTFASGLIEPKGLAFDSADNLFVTADFGNIYEFTPGGTRSTFASGLGLSYSGLAFNSAGNLFEADPDKMPTFGIINEFTPDGTRSTFASGLNPVGLAFNSAGNLFVTDRFSGNIYEFTPGGTRSTFASGLAGPYGLAFNSAGNLFESDAGSGNIYEFTPGGTRSTFASGLNNPEGLAFNSAGNLFEADSGSGNIYEFTPGGTRSIFASGLNRPDFLAFEPVPALQLSAAFSRKTHGGAGDFYIDLPLAGEPGVECRSGGAGGVYTLVFTFTNNVVSGNASVTPGVGTVSGVPAFSGNTMTVNLTGVADVQRITVTLTSVHDSFGQILPDTAVSANMLIGDTTGNRTVNASDIAQVKAQAGMPVDATNFREDLNVDGVINASDIGLVKSKSGDSLP